MNKYIIAVDPGVSGGIAFLSPNGFVTALAADKREEIREIIKRISNKNTVAYMEQVGGFMGREESARGSHMFAFGNADGFFEGLLFMAEIPVLRVQPKTWIREVLPGTLGMDYNDRKRALAAYVRSIYDEKTNITLKTSDALAMLEYARRKECGELRVQRDKTIEVINTSGNYKFEAKQALAWAKKNYPAHQIPKRGSKDYIALVNYWCKNIKAK